MFNHIKLLQHQWDTLKLFFGKQTKILTDRNDEMAKLKDSAAAVAKNNAAL